MIEWPSRDALFEAMQWNLDAMRRAKRDGREDDAWRHSNNAESIRFRMAQSPREGEV